MVNSLLTDGYATDTKGNNGDAWFDIPGYEGIYQASLSGMIRTKPGKVTSNSRYSRRLWRTRILKPKSGGKRADYRVTLWRDGKKRDALVARLVAMTWVPGYGEDVTINHINGDIHDNRAVNLECVLLGTNIKKGFSTGLYASICKAVSLIAPDGSKKEFRSMAAASRAIGRNNGYVSNMLKKHEAVHGVDGTEYGVEILNG